MAYCLRSFIETLEQVLHPHKHYKKWVLNHDNIPQIQSLFDNATFLQDFLDKSSPLIQETISSLEDQIMNAAQKAADTLESYITDQLLSNPKDQSFTIFPPDMGEALHAFEVAKEEVIKIECASQPSYHNNVSPSVSRTPYPDSKNMVVGIEEDLKQLRSRLTSARVTELDVIPIVGMGGIGKTTLARILYDEFSSKSHFDRCAWITVSQSYDPQQILKTLLACVNGKEKSHQEINELMVTLYKTLFGRRYLIVIDDIWSCKAWDELKRAFPQDNKGSRIILTTRENTVAKYVKSGTDSHEMNLINDDDSWVLLRGKVFGQEACPVEFEEVGKRIATNCGGLPLALQVIGGLLSQSQRSIDFWKHVVDNVSSMIANTDDRFSGIFLWSFSHLPHYLKPCFLYMGAFPEDYEIPASRIIKLWIAEGFLYPVPNKSLEEAAEIHLNALVDRNLIFVRGRSYIGKAKTYGIHDLLRDLCLKKAEEKKFLYVKDSKTDILQEDMLCLHRLSVHLSDARNVDYERGSLKLTSHSRSFLLTSNKRRHKFVSYLCFDWSLLRVLDVYQSKIIELTEVFLKLVNLRYLAIYTSWSIPTSISVLENLQTLIVTLLESVEILEDLPQLRHLEFLELQKISYERSFSVHENLQSLSCYVPLETLTGLLGKLPKLRKLGIQGDANVDITCFQELETLYWMGGFHDYYTFLYTNTFPPSLKKLTLDSCGVPQTLLNTIGILPELQVLILDRCSFESLTWEPTEGEFCQLQYLEICRSNMEKWLATEIHFPVLRHLVLDTCHELNEIPNDIGRIETLEMIEMSECKPSAFESARIIFEEQREFGNTLLQLRLGSELEEHEQEEE